jgi:apolipoprotein N-acyltransferase
LAVGNELLGVTICYEDVFGAEQLAFARNASILVNVSNDAWFGDSIAAHQHLQIARLRAAEAGRYLLRATNTGISAVINPQGEIMERSPQFRAAVLRAEVTGMDGHTPYARFGDWPAMMFSVLMLLVAVARQRFSPPQS